MNPLQVFYNNEVEREAVKAFLMASLRELAADNAMEGLPTTGIYEAGKCVERCFDKLEEMYNQGVPTQPVNTR